jgi:cytochrome bd-type quinol oxidase subunit 2
VDIFGNIIGGFIFVVGIGSILVFLYYGLHEGIHKTSEERNKPQNKMASILILVFLMFAIGASLVANYN